MLGLDRRARSASRSATPPATYGLHGRKPVALQQVPSCVHPMCVCAFVADSVQECKELAYSLAAAAVAAVVQCNLLESRRCVSSRAVCAVWTSSAWVTE